MKWRSLLTLLMVLLFSCDSSSKPVLNLFTWSGLLNPSVIADFEKKFNCRVIIDIYDSNESMYAKLKLGSMGYDIIFPSNYYLDILHSQGMIQSLNRMQIPNLKHLDPQYFNPENGVMAVPFVVSFSGIAYRKDRVSSIEPSWTVFGKADYKGRMTMLNDAREVLGAALKTLGHSINTTDAQAIAQAADLAIEWKQNLAKFESDQYKSGIVSGEFLIVQAYSLDIMQVQEEDEEVEFLFPREGGVLSIDYMSIPQNASNGELAYAFINYMLEPEVAAKNMAQTNALIPVLPSYPLLSERLKNSPILFPSEQERKKMELIEDLGEGIKPYYKAWERVKAS